MEIRRGEIWWADLGEPAGSGPGGRRPVLVIQSDGFNRSRVGTTIVLALSSNLDLLGAPGNVLLPARATGLKRDSTANASQLTTIDRALLIERVASISNQLLDQVDDGLRLVLNL